MAQNFKRRGPYTGSNPKEKRKLTDTFIYTIAWLNSSFNSEPLQNSVGPLPFRT